MAHTVIPPPRGTTTNLELTHKGNINDKTIPEREREVRDLSVYTLKKSLLCVRLVRHSMRSAGVASTVRSTSLGRWLLVACFSSIKNHNVSGPHLFPSVTKQGGRGREERRTQEWILAEG